MRFQRDLAGVATAAQAVAQTLNSSYHGGMKNLLHSFVLTPVRREQVTAAEFVRIAQERPCDIARSRFVPPRLGEKGFGQVDVEYTTPILRSSTTKAVGA